MTDVLLIILCILIIICIWIMLYDSTHFVKREYRLESPKLEKSCRAVVLADLHGKRYGRDNELLLRAIDDIKPDIILIAGDMLTAKPRASVDRPIALRAGLKEKYPIYYANGNHEHRLMLYPDNYGNMAASYEEKLSEIDIRRLVNESVLLGEYGIRIYGSQIEKEYYRRFRHSNMQPEYLDSLLGKCDRDCFSVLIAHDPEYFDAYAGWGAELTLSGHIHGGVIRVPIWGKGVASPNLTLFPKYDGGLYTEKGRKMILSRGLGMHTIPIRLFNPGELVVVDFGPDKRANGKG